MKKIYKKLCAFFLRSQTWLYSATAFCLANPVFADEKAEAEKAAKLAAEKAKAAQELMQKLDGNFLGALQSYLGQGGRILLLAVSALGFVWVSYAALTKFNECRTNKAEWAELGVLVIVAAGILVFITLLMGQGEGAMSRLATGQ